MNCAGVYKSGFTVISEIILSVLFCNRIYADTVEKITIPIGGNSWLANNPLESNQIITEKGICNWTKSDSRIRIYFRLEKTGSVQLYLQAKVESGKSILKTSFGDISKKNKLNKSRLCSC